MDIKTTDLVEKKIDEAIRTFNPTDPNSFEHWDAEFQRLESLLRDEASPLDPQDLLATVMAKRVEFAFEVGRFDLVVDQSSSFVRAIQASHPSFSNVAILRMRALHAIGAHETEIQEALAIARRPEITGGEYVALLEHLSTRHPGNIPSDDQLSAKMLEAISTLCAQGYEILPPPADKKMQLEETALRVASELRRINRAKGDALLADGIP